MKRTIACSVISCKDVLGGNTRYQEEIISDKTFNAEYEETRVLLGHRPDSRTMAVLLSPHRREKLLSVIEEGGWLNVREHPNIIKIAQINGLLANTGKHFHWL